ncbi:NAD(P)H-dependent oxidoreductase [Paenibacillus radicis (ex Gao et al. 2016)]|uniref:NAD(P)H dehydrogenase (Quinone) n=1 Tax=Paenibacillus radicis (ex Gao et al. 2016) TaxID=1737354 RepID=A0A917H7Q0_9BACL|nr:NAD(P)H-dependent oxidoreductase [Paenibacillus radicis (ex Gao et al. 2016)]GGG70219.1 NAD(P)H dehydrogenase (quinone) [Paenibacillus radicis (ex Gao et al. 2016)]
MQIMLILAHPKKGSFNHAIAERIHACIHQLGHSVWSHDLYEENFDAVYRFDHADQEDVLVQLHREQIRRCDGLIIVHPNWWGQPPAILKGWMDQVLVEDVAYGFDPDDNGSGVPTGLLHAEQALIINTSNTPLEREQSVFQDPLEMIWKNCVLYYCGIKNVERKVFRVIADSTYEDRTAWLAEAENLVQQYFK